MVPRPLEQSSQLYYYAQGAPEETDILRETNSTRLRSPSSEILSPARGRLTFEAEGTAQPASRFYSRAAHHPSPASGVTLGRGYDMSRRSHAQIFQDLLQSGVQAAAALRFAEAAGLSGKSARQFIENSSLPELSALQELQLFEISYAEAEQDVIRIINLPDVISAYGATDWGGLAQPIKDVLIDLRFRGDYTPSTRRFVQRAVSSNDLEAFTRAISDRRYWPHVPRDRFERRANFLLSANLG